jgi:hypothetical protein
LVSAWLTDLPFDWGDMPRGTRTRAYAKNETLFLEGQVADTVYLIREGRVRLTSFGVDGKERHLMILGANGLVGDCALHSAQAYVVSAVAATDTRGFRACAFASCSGMWQRKAPTPAGDGSACICWTW